MTLQEPEAESETLNAALAYARKGWPVAPAHSVQDGRCSCHDSACGKQAGKHPRTRHGLTDATTDESTILGWWGKWPDANVLIRTGKIGDRYLVVVDVDPRHGGDENFAALVVEHGALRHTPTVLTGGGGRHYFLWSTHALRSTADHVARGVDIRGVGGYVIAAPSIHASGKRYHWVDGAGPDEVMAECPPWLAVAAGLAGTRVKGDPHSVGGGEILEIFEGGRNNALTRIAGSTRRSGVGLVAILSMLRVANQSQCRPPLDDWEVERIARSIASRPAGDPVKGDATDPMPMLNWCQVAAPLPPVPWLVEALAIAPGAVTIVGGAGGGGKTWAMMAMAVAIAARRPVWGQYVARYGRCVHIDFEQGPYMTRMRYQKIAAGLDIRLEDLDPSSFGLCSLPRPFNSCDKSVEDTLVNACTGAVMVIIDAFRGAFPKAKENDSEAREYLDMLQRVSERTGCTVVVIAHSRKASEDNDIRSSLRGSSALFDAAQTVYMLDGMPGRPTRVTCTKDRWTGKSRPSFGITRTDVLDVAGELPGVRVEYITPTEVEAAYDTTADENDISHNVERMISMRARMIEVLKRHPEGLTVATTASLLTGGRQEKGWRDTLAEMVRDGSARQNGKGPHAVYTWCPSVERRPGED